MKEEKNDISGIPREKPLEVEQGQAGSYAFRRRKVFD